MRKAQAAMEFLMTYGWAILVVLVAIGALVSLGVLNQDKLLPEECVIPPGSGLYCDQYSTSATADTVTLRLKNTLTDSIWVDAVSTNSPSCTYATADAQIVAGATTDFTLSCAAGLSSGDKIKATITLTYDVGTSAGTGLSKTATGKLVTAVA